MIGFYLEPPIRNDAQGLGHFGAPRGGRKHNGIDFASMPGSFVHSKIKGEVTKIGYPYPPSDERKGHLRYIQVTDSKGYNVRYFYVKPEVEVGALVGVGAVLGIVEDLTKVYPGMTPHVHVEIKGMDGEFIDPNDYTS